jgi:hypothetical protein
VTRSTRSKRNNRAIIDGTRLLSAYVIGDGSTRIWITSEAIAAR